MIILFAPSEGKRAGGEGAPLSRQSLLFPQLYDRRVEAIKCYEAYVRSADTGELNDFFGVKDPLMHERYLRGVLETPTMPAMLRYDGVAYDYLDFPTLDPEAQKYIGDNVIVFSNLFGPIGALDKIPDYKLKQGSSIGGFVLEKFYREHFSQVLDEYIAEREILDLRAGFYDKFYTPKMAPTTLKFLKEGKVVSHWAKAYRGIVLRACAVHQIGSVKELLALNIEGLKFDSIVRTKKKNEIIYSIV